MHNSHSTYTVLLLSLIMQKSALVHTRRFFSRQPPSFLVRASSTATGGKDPEWRKMQLDRLRRTFEEPINIESDEELQPMWKDMESRVVRRRSLTIEQAGGRIGRSNIRPTDEESWLQAGMYDQLQEDTDTAKEDVAKKDK